MRRLKRLAPFLLLSLMACGRDETIRSELTAVEGPPDGGALNPVAWKTPFVSLKADDFWIVADGQRFTGQGAEFALNSDPGNAEYTTLEVVWMEGGVEMRLNIYFAADPTGWWSGEMRTYNAQPAPNSDWLFYSGTFFASSIGAPFRGDIDLTNDATNLYRGELHMHGVVLSTTLAGQ
jgi:hypothetical protein